MTKQVKTKDEREALKEKRYKFCRNLCLVVSTLVVILYGVSTVWQNYHTQKQTQAKIANARLNESGLTDGLQTQESVTIELSKKLAPNKPLLQETRELLNKFEQAAKDEFWLDESFKINSSVATSLNQYKLISMVYADGDSLDYVTQLVELAVTTAKSSPAGWDIIELHVNNEIFIQLPSRAAQGLAYIPLGATPGLLVEESTPQFNVPPMVSIPSANIQWRTVGTELQISGVIDETVEVNQFVNDFLMLYNEVYTNFEKMSATSIVINLQAANCGVVEWMDAGTFTQYSRLMQETDTLAQSVLSSQVHRYYGNWTGEAAGYFDTLINTLCN